MDNILLESPKLEVRQRLAARLLSLMPPLHRLPPKLFRPLFLIMDRLLGLGKTPMFQVVDYLIPVTTETSTNDNNGSKISIRAYYPNDLNESNQKDSQRTLVYFHGGGCVIGNIETHDRFCRYLAKHSNMTVISVDYRLSPEYKFPTPVCDAIDAWNWINHHHKQLKLNPSFIGVGGDSAGGYLSCVIGQPSLQKELSTVSKYKPNFQFLLYPMLNLQGKTESFKKFSQHLILTNKLMSYFRKHFLNSLSEADLPVVSPLLSTNINCDIDTYILTLGFDPLRDDGIAYSEKLKQENDNVTHEHYADCMHAFISVTSLSSRAKDATHKVANALARFNQ